MSENADKDKQKHQMLFMHLVMMMSSSAMQQMGKIVNPMTNKTTVDLDGAAFAIDMLDMIAARTAGNLEADEERLLKSQLADLRLNFVDASDQARKGKTEPKTDETEASTPSESSSSGSTTDERASANAEHHSDENASETEPPETVEKAGENPEGARFHKSYG